MNYTIQDAATTLFNAAEIPASVLDPWLHYVDMLVASPKKSVLYYWTEENGQIPWWTLLRSLPSLASYASALWDAVWQRIEIHLDRRRPTCVVIDDYVARCYGHTAYLTDYFYSNAHGGVVLGNALVDTDIRNGELSCPVAFELHERRGSLMLWERALAQVRHVRARLRAAGVRPDRLWTLGDYTYGNAAMAVKLRPKGGFYLLSIPKTRIVELFG